MAYTVKSYAIINNTARDQQLCCLAPAGEFVYVCSDSFGKERHSIKSHQQYNLEH